MEVNKINDDIKKSFRTRVISAIVLVAIAVPSVLLGGWIFFILMLAVSGLICFEILTAKRNEKKYNPIVWIMVYIFFFAAAFWMLLKHNLITLSTTDTAGKVWWSFEGSFFTAFEGHEGGIATLDVSTMGIVATVLVLFLYTILKADFDVKDVFYLFTMIVFVGLGVESFMFLRYFPTAVFNSYAYGTYNYNWISTCTLLLYVILETVLTDTGAYIVGVLFGKHKMNPRISPKKTWEGFFGGIGLGAILGILYLFIFSLVGYPVLPMFDVVNSPICWVYVCVISVILPFVSTLGDFLFSAIKRNFEIKDFSNLIPGHGGILDRLDSLICSSLVATIFIILVNNNWSLLV